MSYSGSWVEDCEPEASLAKQRDIGSKIIKQRVRHGLWLKAQAAFPENPGWFPAPTWKVPTL